VPCPGPYLNLKLVLACIAPPSCTHWHVLPVVWSVTRAVSPCVHAPGGPPGPSSIGCVCAKVLLIGALAGADFVPSAMHIQRVGLKVAARLVEAVAPPACLVHEWGAGAPSMEAMIDSESEPQAEGQGQGQVYANAVRQYVRDVLRRALKGGAPAEDMVEAYTTGIAVRLTPRLGSVLHGWTPGARGGPEGHGGPPSPQPPSARGALAAAPSSHNVAWKYSHGSSEVTVTFGTCVLLPTFQLA